MKKCGSLFLAVALGLGGFTAGTVHAASGNTNAIPLAFAISGVLQHMTILTNGNSVTTTYTTASIKITNQYILNLLQAEFGSTFPAGAQLVYNLTGAQGFHVLDSAGTPILDASVNPLDSSYGFGLSNAVTGADFIQVLNGSIAGNLTNNDLTEVVTVLSPDYGIFFYDSHGNNFHIDGLLTLKVNATVKSSVTTYNSVSLSITGNGGGTMFNPVNGLYETGVFNKVKVAGKASGLIQ